MDFDAGSDDDVFEDARERVDRPMLRLFTGYGRGQLGAFVVGLCSSIVARMLDLLPPILLALAIDAIFLQETEYGLFLVPDAWIPSGQGPQLWLTAGIIAASFGLGAVFHWSRNWGWNKFAQHVQHAVRTDTYETMQRLNMDFFADKQTGEMMSVLSNDVNRLEKFLNDGLNSASRMIIMVVGIATYLFYMNWQLALVALLPVPLIAVFTKRFIETIQPKYAEVRSTVGKLNSRLENNLSGIQIIKTANTEPYEADRVEDSSADYLDANWDAIETRITFFPGLRLVSGIGFVVTFVVGGLMVTGQAPGPLTAPLSRGQFVAFIIYTQRFVWPMAQFGQIINMYQRAYASAERVFGLMDTPGRLEEAEDAPPLAVTDGRVEYDDVTFGYDSDDPVLSDVSFEAEGGETVALVGPTGAGKSTVLKLLLRMYDVDEGAVRIDGQNVQDVQIQSIRRAIGYVSQETFLFYGTVRENIAYGSFDATDEEIVAAAEAAEADQFVRNLPDGYDTMVGERGVKLSGGQRQRIAIARAMLKDPEILILDEATSDVDTETEMLIQRSLDDLTADRTTFAIAHRLSTVKDADTILVVEDGRIVERGSHDELLAADGLYANLWAVQAGEIDELPEDFVERAIQRRARTDADD
ncbi:MULTISPECIES: ABC transporter ATP-binding protein [unclassified Haloarcula]|uniref:ABC transporter ATP-binding protein n=1 Tax=Haloarcula TaxID=2237 RepID=UPI000EF1304D|nr:MULTISPECIES: ABC transporter ATP-binding protein [unclassified Haloarcula]RLM39841.1 ABC transporter ATP-binding protein [Haloarcula sp. Atlit-120R]RLM47830.1 ABC transporter ATP-binding protein [Haloarcula sp. Atlit-47R]RLM96242.1 ABC transporter ATP-binding protein [Haloarcula sp. Atlit-7R]